MSPSEEPQASSVRVFISYSHDSREHCDQILAFAQQLRLDGIEAELDQFHQDELVHWPRWCEEQLRPENSKYVLCVCTAEYRRRVENRVPADVGKGVFWEASLIYNYLYDEKDNKRCVPVLIGAAREDTIPAIFGGWNRYHLRTFRLKDGDPGYEDLYRLLTAKPKVKPEPLGESKTLLEKVAPGAPEQVLPPLLEIPERKTDFMGFIEEIHRKVAHIEQVSIETKADTSEIKVGVDEIKAGIDKILAAAPPPSTQERPHNLPPWMAPEYFVGRGEQLRALWDALSAPSADVLAVVQPHVVRGGGGIGKTRLAIQAVWALYLRGKCDMAFFLSALSPDELDTQLAGLDARSLLDLYEGQESPRELAARRQNVIHALREKAGRWILLLDAADSEKARDAVNGLLKELPGGRFVITSRRDDWPRATVRKLPLELFTLEEARACLLSRYWKSDPSAEERADFDDVARELDFLPLALVLAASYMESRRITPGLYLRDLREKLHDLLGFSAKDVDYDRSLLAAFRVSYEQLESSERSLLHVLCWLAPEPFPRQLVEDSEAIRQLLGGGGEIAAVLGELRTLSFIQLDEESLRMHKLMTECARAVQDDETRGSSFPSALHWLAQSLPSTDFDVAGWAIWGRLGPHLEALIQKAESFGLEDDNVALICAQYGFLLYRQARHPAAEPLMKRALAIDEKSYGPEHPRVAEDLNNLALLLRDTNRLGEAEPLMKRAVAIDEKSYGLDHPNVARDLNNLAQLLKATNRLGEAEPLYRRALAIDEKSYGPEHPRIATYLSNLALLLQATNRLGEAEPLMKHALAINEKRLGPEHPNVAICLNNFALLLRDTNRLGEAEPLMKRALAIDEKSYGPEHPDVARDLNNLALLLQATNQLGEAEPLYLRALAIDEKSYGPEHPHVAIRLNNLAQLLQDTNRLGEAEPLMKRALAIDEKSYGPEHPRVAEDLNNLALLLQDTNRLGEAEPLMKRALAIDEKSYGPEHPNVARDLNNLAQLLQATNRLGEAEPLYRRALAIDEKSYGPEHPTVAIRLNNLAQLLKATNRLGEAEPLMRRALVILLKFTHETGHPHPHLRAALYNYFALLKEMSLGEEEIRERIAQVGIDAGLDRQGFSKLLEKL